MLFSISERGKKLVFDYGISRVYIGSWNCIQNGLKIPFSDTAALYLSKVWLGPNSISIPIKISSVHCFQMSNSGPIWIKQFQVWNRPRFQNNVCDEGKDKNIVVKIS